MRRRDFIALLGAAAVPSLLWPLAARAQDAESVRRVGVLTGYAESDSEGQAQISGFRTTLRQLGWTEGRNVQIDVRWGEAANPALMETYANELVAMNPDVIVVNGGRALTAVNREPRRIPIVFAALADPVATGVVESLARPGGNVTGFTIFDGASAPKHIEALREIAPGLARVALVISPDNSNFSREVQLLNAAATPFGMKSIAMPVRVPADIERAIAEFAREPNGGLVVTSEVVISAHRSLIIASALRNRLPTMHYDRSYVVAGGLMSYGIDRRDQYRRVADYVDRILKGAKPSDLPVQQPVKFEFAINLRTAAALGLTVPTALLLRADEVIE